MTEHTAENDARCPRCGHPLTCEWHPVSGECENAPIPPDVPRDRAPRNYTELRALLDDSLRDIPPESTDAGS